MTFQVEDFEAIRRRQEEIRAEKDLALTGSSVVQPTVIADYAMGWPMTAAADYDPA
jgi:hypothetical protein